MDFRSDSRFRGIEPFRNKVWLSSPTMHGEELRYVTQVYETNWMSTVGENIEELERAAKFYTKTEYTVALSCGTAALHLAVKLAAEKLYNSSSGVSMPEMDYEALDKAIRPKTKAIITVVLYGIVCNYAKVFENVEKRELYLYLLNLLVRHSVTFLPVFRKQSVA